MNSKSFYLKSQKGAGIHNEKQALGFNKSSSISIQVRKKDEIFLTKSQKEVYWWHWANSFEYIHSIRKKQKVKYLIL